MSLTSLAHFDGGTAASIVATAALLSGPHVSDASSSPFEAQAAIVLKEVREQLGISEADATPQAMRRIDDALSKELDRVGFHDIDPGDVESRLSTRGELPASSYHKTVNPLAVRVFREKKQLFRDAVNSADIVQHLSVDVPQVPADQQGRTSLFMKRVGSGVKEHWLLVTADRRDMRLHLMSMWRLFPDILPFEDNYAPLDALRVFALHYGVDVEIPDVARGKFLADILLGVWPSQQQRRVHSGVLRNTFYQESVYRTPEDLMMLAYAYAIDQDQYIRDVQQRVRRS